MQSMDLTLCKQTVVCLLLFKLQTYLIGVLIDLNVLAPHIVEI